MNSSIDTCEELLGELKGKVDGISYMAIWKEK